MPMREARGSARRSSAAIASPNFWSRTASGAGRIGVGRPRRFPTCFRCQRAEAPMALCVVIERKPQLLFIEIRPQTVGEMQLGVRDFPEHEITKALLTAGANQQIDWARRQRGMIDLLEQAMKVIRCQFRSAIGPPRGSHNTVVRGVVEHNTQAHSRTSCAQSLTPLDGAQKVRIQAVAPSDDVDANGLRDTATCLRQEIFAKETHQSIDLPWRACPICRRKGV